MISKQVFLITFLNESDVTVALQHQLFVCTQFK